MRGRCEIDNIAAIPKPGHDSIAPQRSGIQGYRQKGRPRVGASCARHGPHKKCLLEPADREVVELSFCSDGAGCNERSPGPRMAAGCCEQDGGLNVF